MLQPRTVWNVLPSQLRSSSISRGQFRAGLKTHFFTVLWTPLRTFVEERIILHYIYIVGIWLLQSCGVIFCLSLSMGTNRLQEVAAPATVDDMKTTNSVTFSTFSAAQDALCGLMADGRLFVRTGMGPHCPTGVDWTAVHLPDLGLLLIYIRDVQKTEIRFGFGF